MRLLDGEQRRRALRILADALDGTLQPAADPLAVSMLLATRPEAPDAGPLVGRAMTRLADAGVGVADLSLGQPSLDEAFLALTGHQAGTPTPEAAPHPATTTDPEGRNR